MISWRAVLAASGINSTASLVEVRERPLMIGQPAKGVVDIVNVASRDFTISTDRASRPSVVW